jgi:catechol 2,3-dioxygenase-like lactoylglutathione lyase family enzyme
MVQSPDAGPQFEGISPVFPVSDVRAALVFYRERLGFELGWTWGEPPTHANVCRGAFDITLTLEPSKSGTGEAYVYMRGGVAYWAELRARNLAPGELDDRPYGMRDFDLVDTDGNRLVFGEAIAG